MKVWQKKYNNHLIRIENYWNKEILLLDGKIQDDT